MNTRRGAQNTPNRTAVTAPSQQQGSYAQQQQQQQQFVDKKPIIGGTQSNVTPELDATEKKPKPEWQLRKLDPETRRLRQNARVKRVVKPKSAIIVLHEMYPEIVYKIDEVASNKMSIYRVHFELNTKQYSGEGFSKNQAKQTACENALKALLLEKIAKEQEAEKATPANAMETDEEVKKTPATDDFPWGKLASFALQKLMDSCNEKAQVPPPGFPIPAVGNVPYGGHQTFSHPNHVSFSNYNQGGFQPQFGARETVFQASKPLNGTAQNKTLPRKKFPDNPLELNAFALFNQTWPNSKPAYETQTGADGQPQHSASLVLEGYRFSAVAKSKKVAKLNLAKAIISTLKGVKYPEPYIAQVSQV